MKYVLFVALLVVAASASPLEEYETMFLAFKARHGKTYKNTIEESRRFSIFKDNIRAIEEHNELYERGLVSYKKAISQFADLTHEEFMARLMTHPKPTLPNTISFIKTGVSVDASKDWREEGQVTEVKDQGRCGACWAFSVTGATEAAYYRKHKTLKSLSEQQLIDCSNNAGCAGGYLERAFDYVKEYGLESEESYNYTGMDGSCNQNASNIIAKIDQYVSIENLDEAGILEAVGTVGPVSVLLDASYLTFYSTGIYEDSWCSHLNLNHAVLIVGYGNQNGKNFWIVKNSWGPDWGEQGYFRISRGFNECGIAEDAVYPIIN